ncbi:MAG: hypothetical protein F9B45_04940 [Phycisphaera sp. RhM]|nr:hypothetical protein [Phycisphaera sp. RhM]
MADPLQFDPDFRWFEPIYDMDLADMKPKKRANTGWFATYDRLNLYGSRPELEDNSQGLESGLDSGWGHRYEIGFMLPDEDNGWLFSWVDNDVGEFFSVRKERGNRFNEDELDGDATNPAPPFGFEAIPGISNNRGFNYRFVDEKRSENVIDFDSYELSKTWRMEPYHYGGILEPMVGFRWFRIDDTNVRQNFISSNDASQIALAAAAGVTLVDTYGAAAEQMTTDQAFTENEAITGQIGFRYFKFFDRFTFATDFKVFSGANFQSSFNNRHVEAVIYDGTDTIEEGDEVSRILYSETDRVYTRNEEFFLGFDVRGELGYQLSRAVTVRAGFQLIDVARGLWRGGDLDNSVVRGGDNDQDYLMVGGTFGITLNR